MEFVLDVSKWVCGIFCEPESHMGDGPSQLLNEQGYQCCVGQFAEQCGTSRDKMLGRGGILGTDKFDGDLTPLQTTIVHADYDGQIDRGPLHAWLYPINDDGEWSPDETGARRRLTRSIPEKIEEIRRLLGQAGHTLKVINYESIPVTV